MFTQSVIEQLGYYVYFLRDPRDYKVFYVGKGKGNRVFEHVAGTLASATESEKMDRIREISQAGKSVEHFVLRHGLSESSAFEVEAAIIDFVGLPNVANIQGGRNSTDFGIRTTEEVSAMYSAAPFETHERVILININKLFRRDMTATELYDATRKEWRIGPRRENAAYAVPTYRGLTREVYKICTWRVSRSASRLRRAHSPPAKAGVLCLRPHRKPDMNVERTPRVTVAALTAPLPTSLTTSCT